MSPAVTPEPKALLMLWMPETALPSPSTTQKYVVSPGDRGGHSRPAPPASGRSPPRGARGARARGARRAARRRSAGRRSSARGRRRRASSPRPACGPGRRSRAPIAARSKCSTIPSSCRSTQPMEFGGACADGVAAVVELDRRLDLGLERGEVVGRHQRAGLPASGGERPREAAAVEVLGARRRRGARGCGRGPPGRSACRRPAARPSRRNTPALRAVGAEGRRPARRRSAGRRASRRSRRARSGSPPRRATPTGAGRSGRASRPTRRPSRAPRRPGGPPPGCRARSARASPRAAPGRCR